MKKVWIILAILICLAAIIGGKIYWQHKISKTTSEGGTAAQTEQVLGTADTNTSASLNKAREKKTDCRTAEVDAKNGSSGY
ncbi:hypothetical protein QS257_16995 [Terrilactibacillus sp. S3-3]|nr:hypothetical protein QS257_16995 [Terrilactibacillus sp. S3-3]